jgi:UDP-2,4-diacetamido-2,4,6-trideoxy-beta-L-altropyranose hydrolase
VGDELDTTLTKVLIRCDAAPEIGFGHIVRCLALADELRDSYGYPVEFAMVQGTQGFKQAEAQGYSVYTPADRENGLDEGQWLQNLIAILQIRILILDVRTNLEKAAVQFIRESGVLIVTIDDPSERRLAADLAFYPPVPQVERMHWNGFTGQYYVGWDWVLLRPQFSEAIKRSRAKAVELETAPLSSNSRQTILVTMGGSDPAGLTLMALEALEQIDSNLRILVVIGGGFMHETRFSESLRTTKHHYEICRNVTDMASLMMEADLAIASFGTTAYELTALRVPAVYLCLTADHAEAVKALVTEGVAQSMGHYKSCTPKSLAQALRLTLHKSYSRKMLVQDVEHIDGMATKRISSVICSLDLDNPKKFATRPQVIPSSDLNRASAFLRHTHRIQRS